MDRRKPIIGALIVNYTTYQETTRYVEQLKCQVGVRLYVLIVDNCSPNESFPYLLAHFEKDDLVQVIQSERNGGYAYGNNFGLRYLHTKMVDYVLITNNDIAINDPHLLQQMVTHYRKLDDAGFVAPRMYVAGKENIKHQAYKIPGYKDSLFASLRLLYWMARKLNWTNTYQFSKYDIRSHPVDCVSGAFFMGAKDVFFEIGLFDEQTFLYCEEAILSKKIAAVGKQNYQLRSLSVDHTDGRTTRGLNSRYRLQREWLKSTIYYHRQYEKCSAVGIIALRILYFIWVLETMIVELVGKVSKKR